MENNIKGKMENDKEKAQVKSPSRMNPRQESVEKETKHTKNALENNEMEQPSHDVHLEQGSLKNKQKKKRFLKNVEHTG